jgi:hypothetical protein
MIVFENYFFTFADKLAPEYVADVGSRMNSKLAVWWLDIDW